MLTENELKKMINEGLWVVPPGNVLGVLIVLLGYFINSIIIFCIGLSLCAITISAFHKLWNCKILVNEGLFACENYDGDLFGCDSCKESFKNGYKIQYKSCHPDSEQLGIALGNENNVLATVKKDEPVSASSVASDD